VEAFRKHGLLSISVDKNDKIYIENITGVESSSFDFGHALMMFLAEDKK